MSTDLKKEVGTKTIEEFLSDYNTIKNDVGIINSPLGTDIQIIIPNVGSMPLSRYLSDNEIQKIIKIIQMEVNKKFSALNSKRIKIESLI